MINNPPTEPAGGPHLTGARSLWSATSAPDRQLAEPVPLELAVVGQPGLDLRSQLLLQRPRVLGEADLAHHTAAGGLAPPTYTSVGFS
jgi:hypothetical protein